MITLSVLEAVIQLEDVESGIGPFDSGVRVMRQSQTQTAFRREMHPDADMIAELECRTEVLVREVRAGEHRCPDTGFHVIPVRPGPAQQRCGTELPGAAGVTRSTGMPICGPQFAQKIQTAAALESIRPERRRLPSQLRPLIVIAGAQAQTDARVCVEIRRG